MVLFEKQLRVRKRGKADSDFNDDGDDDGDGENAVRAVISSLERFWAAHDKQGLMQCDCITKQEREMIEISQTALR